MRTIKAMFRIIFIAGLLGIMVTGYGGLCGKKSDSGSSAPLLLTVWTQTSDPTTGTSIESANSIIADVDYLYIAGDDGDGQWRIEKRDKTTGTLVSGFGSAGVITSNPSTDSDRTYSIITDTDYLYIAGVDSSPGEGQWRIEKRDKTTAALDAGFGSAGVITSNPGTLWDAVYSLTADAAYLYMAGEDNSQGSGNQQWRIEKRDKTTGTLVSGFGSGGVVTSDGDTAYSITVDTNYLYIAGRNWGLDNDYQWRIEKRSKTTGELIAGFGSFGVVNADYSTGSDVAWSIITDDNYLYIAGHDATLVNYQWRIEKRDKTTGALVNGFGSEGVVTSNPSPYWERPYSIIADDNYLYICGEDSSPPTGTQWRIEKRNKTSGGR